jgi:Enoyl-(Acyl carrier protein) reductase
VASELIHELAIIGVRRPRRADHQHHQRPPARAEGPVERVLRGQGRLALLTEVLAQQLAASGITVNVMAPGDVATEMTGNEDVDPSTVDRPGIPVGRPGHADEIAAVLALLASPAAPYVTGSSWPWTAACC